MTKLRVLTVPDPILRQKALPVRSVDDEILKLMDDMLEVMYDGGIGLAANQVGSLKRVLVVDIRENSYDEEVENADLYPLCIANPEIIESSEEMEELEEGCLSLPDQRIMVIRPVSIKLRYLDRDNKQQELFADGLLARVIQHEMDHLDGKLLVDYLSKMKKDIAMRKLTKLKKISA
ncbi:MAG: peptide deformylase [Rickettsiales bacterium]|nr:MAG: peptide deformylase [Rickettsiales bacterium]